MNFFDISNPTNIVLSDVSKVYIGKPSATKLAQLNKDV